MRLCLLVLPSLVLLQLTLNPCIGVPTLGPGATAVAVTAGLLALSSLLLLKGSIAGAILIGRRKRDLDKLTDLAYEQLAENSITVDMIAALETEQCFKRVFCSAATGSLKHRTLEDTLPLVEKAMRLAPINPVSIKYNEAVQFGASRRSIEKCESEYPCSFSMDQAKRFFA